MTERTKRKDLEDALQRVCRVMGVPYDLPYDPSNKACRLSLRIDKHAGGYRVETVNGGASPFGPRRRPAIEMLSLLHSLEDALIWKRDEASLQEVVLP